MSEKASIGTRSSGWTALVRDEGLVKRVVPTTETIASALSAYNTLSFTSALIFGFSTQGIPPCEAGNANINAFVTIINALAVGSSFIALTISTVIYYQSSKILSGRGADTAAQFLETTSGIRSIVRTATYVSVFSYLLQYGLCPVAVSKTVTGVVVTLILGGAACMSTFLFSGARRKYAEL
jgi:hypothetical protein